MWQSTLVLIAALVLVSCSKKSSSTESTPNTPTENTPNKSTQPPPTTTSPTPSAGAMCSSGSGTVSDKVHGIVNGTVSNNYPSVVKISINGTASCTGTFVSDSTVITAGHCTARGGNFEVNGVRASNYVGKNSEFDIAILVFPEGTSQFASVVNTQALAGNEIITLVGYGQTDYLNDNATDGLKRAGCNELKGFATRSGIYTQLTSSIGTFIHFRSAKAQDDGRAMTGRGDSGGPIFVDGKLAAVVSFGGTQTSLSHRLSSDPNPEASAIYEFDTNISEPSVLEYLRSAVKDIGARIPGL